LVEATPARPAAINRHDPVLIVLAGSAGLRRSLIAMLKPHWPGLVRPAAQLPHRSTFQAGVITWNGEATNALVDQLRDRRIPLLVLGPPKEFTAERAATAVASWIEVLELPVHPERLIAALRQMTDHLSPGDPDRAKPAGSSHLTFDPIARRLSIGDGNGGDHPVESVMLTEIERRLMVELWAATAPLSREVLLERVWGYRSTITTHTLASHIYRLRQKLQRLDAETALISLADGYRLIRTIGPAA
jgi:DNA-binding response OmpR family regulator